MSPHRHHPQQGSTRPGRRGDRIAAWLLETARAYGGADYELVDLVHHGLGNLDKPGNPSHQQYKHKHTRNWGALIESFDGYVFPIPEYNHSFPGALKNALDYVYREWNDKAAGIAAMAAGQPAYAPQKGCGWCWPSFRWRRCGSSPKVSLIPAFASGVFVPGDGLAGSVATMLAQLIAWSGALLSVRATKANPAA